MYPIPVIEKKDEAWDDPDQHSVSDGQTSENADATEVILLNNNYENTVEVDDMREFEFTDNLCLISAVTVSILVNYNEKLSLLDLKLK